MTPPPQPVPPPPADRSRGPLSTLATLRNLLLAGVVIAIPLVVTIWVLNLAYRFIQGISEPLLRQVVLVPADRAQGIARQDLGDIPGVSFLVTVLLLLLLGFISTNVFGKRVLEFVEKLLLRVPVVATVYAGVKQVIDSFKSFNSGSSFSRVVYVEYPSPGCRLLGFVTGKFYDRQLDESMTAVFLPTAPNPMTGFVIVTPTRNVVDADLTMEEASKLIVSAGLVVPQRLATVPAAVSLSRG